MMGDQFIPAPVKTAVSQAELEKIDVRVGTILAVADVADSDKLVKLVVDFGDHRRNILAGIKLEREDPHAIEGKQALFVVNLEPRKMRGGVIAGDAF